MLDAHFDRLRTAVGDAVRQPDFGTVRRRAGRARRRRAVASGLLATVLAATGFAYAQRLGSDDRGEAGPAPAASGAPDAAWPRMTSVTMAGTDLYGILVRCPRCASELHVSSDGGRSWQHRAVPPTPADADTPRSATLITLASGTVAWSERRAVPVEEAVKSGVRTPYDQLWITSDGGRSWRRGAADTEPLPAIPAGSEPVDCESLQIPACTIATIDPVTGRFAPVAGQPDNLTVLAGWTGRFNVPFGGRLWLPGLDPVTNKLALATSADGGRTWRTHVLGDGMTGMPRVVAGPGATAYALTLRGEDTVDTHYTTDGGKTWHAGQTIRSRHVDGFVTADGSLVVSTNAGLVAGRGAGPYTPVVLPGFPEHPTRPTQVTTGRTAEPYLVTSETGPLLSRDGRTWRPVRLP